MDTTQPNDQTPEQKPIEDEKAIEREPDEVDEKIAKDLKSRLEAAKKNRKEMHDEWKRNVELRLGHPFSRYVGGIAVDSTGDQDQTEINPDWSLTKTKTANLWGQVPSVQGTHDLADYEKAIPPWMKALNFELGDKRIDMSTSMKEVLNDCVNAAGVGAIHFGWAARFEMMKVAAVDLTRQHPPEVINELVKQDLVPTKEVPKPVNGRLFGTRISPSKLLWPAEFAGSDFNKADFNGYSGSLPWGEGKHELNLTEEERETLLASNDGAQKLDEDLRSSSDKGGLTKAKVIKFDEIYYWRYRVDPDCKYFDEIWRIVWVEGLEKPKIHEKYKGQKLNEQSGQYVGVRKFPIQFLTLTYISDNPVPPSDSSAGRPQVNDMRRSRSQMFQQRERSIPIRWYDTNRVDPLVADTLMRGTWQGMIPTNGNGDSSIGEIARASYPPEDISFDVQAGKDLMQSWGLGPEQIGAPTARQNKEQTQAAAAGTATRIGQERGETAAYFLNCCEVVSGLMSMFGDFPTLTMQEKQTIEPLKQVSTDIAMTIRPDSTIVLDVGQRIQRVTQFLNIAAKSGFVNIKSLIVELAELSGLDPAKVIVDPQPKPPEEPNISLRFTGKDDLMNAMVMAFMIHGKRAPDEKDIEQAKKLLLAAQMPPSPQQPQAPGGMPPGAGGAPGQPPPPGGPGAPAGIKPGEDMHPDMALANKVFKRSRDIGGG